MERADAFRILISSFRKSFNIAADLVHVDDFVHQTQFGADFRTRFGIESLDQIVHLIDGRLQILAGFPVFGQSLNLINNFET